MKDQMNEKVECYECGNKYGPKDGVQMYEHSRSVDGRKVMYLCELCREEVEDND